MAESEEEVDVLVQRVVKDISNAFKRHPSIDEIGFIQCPEARYNRSPIVLLENKLGVESWCVKFLLPYVHNKLLLYRQRKHWLDREALVDITCTLLLLNPDFTTAWNVRKELLQCGALSPERDLYLGKLTLTKFPKSPETWIHRRWVLQQILNRFPAVGHHKILLHREAEVEVADAEITQHANDHLAQIILQEMMVCADAASRYPSNYNAWSHRIWVLRHMAQGNSKVFHDELSSLRLWVSMHVSDHSGFHYRQFLLKELITDLNLGPELWSNSGPQKQASSSPDSSYLVDQLFYQEMEFCSDLILSFPGHEALWSHRRHVFYLWHQWKEHHRDCSSSRGSQLKHLSELEDQGRSCLSRHGHGSVLMEVDLVSLEGPEEEKKLRGVLPPGVLNLPAEHLFVSSLLDSCCSHEQRSLALAYRKWLDMVIGVQS
uniref:Protein prenyltransferase alpha subunit repeat containing 1 n=1 Tax=Nothobranchius kuhntae TaxID=321403 RepID=A0A1A8KL55_NOTKU